MLCRRAFDTVELNVTFYRMPSSATFRAWAARVPPGFIFAVKASRYLTHIRRLRDPRPRGRPPHGPCQRARIAPRTRPPPAAARHAVGPRPRSTRRSRRFRRTIRVAVEPRHASWFTDELCRAALGSRRSRSAWPIGAARSTPAWRTADWTYLRFHGGRARPSSCYARRALDQWAAAGGVGHDPQRPRVRLLQQRRQRVRAAGCGGLRTPARGPWRPRRHDPRRGRDGCPGGGRSPRAGRHGSGPCPSVIDATAARTRRLTTARRDAHHAR